MSKKTKKNTENVMTDEDKRKFEHLTDFYDLKKVQIGATGEKNYYLVCLACGPKTAPKSTAESSLSNLKRHYKSHDKSLRTKLDEAWMNKPRKRLPTQVNYTFKF